MSFIESVKQREQRYRAEILRRSPPSNTHDAFMLQFYQELLESIQELQRLDTGKERAFDHPAEADQADN
ncbi:MAG: hypothetical protein KDI63_16585 [Gammaproteobacteria bacterium]|nr:hypothetical protein [Gammaproteobacteria bacterium]